MLTLLWKRVLLDVAVGALGLLLALLAWTLADDLWWLHQVHVAQRRQLQAAQPAPPPPATPPTAQPPPAQAPK
jgi:hypothetical protein